MLRLRGCRAGLSPEPLPIPMRGGGVIASQAGVGLNGHRIPSLLKKKHRIGWLIRLFAVCVAGTLACNGDGATGLSSDVLQVSVNLAPDTASVSSGRVAIRIRVTATNPSGRSVSVNLGAPPMSGADPRANRGTEFGYRVYLPGAHQPVGPSADDFGNQSVISFAAGETRTREFVIDVTAPFGLGLPAGTYGIVGVFNRTISEEARLVVLP